MSQNFFGKPPDYEVRRQALVDWWTDLSRSGDAGCMSWEVLDEIQAQVTAALALGPPGIDQAEHFTARAALLLCGQINV
jgi:hypothetical protein